MKQTIINRNGETNVNKYGSFMTIIEYKNANSILVEFKNGYKVHTTYSNFKIGQVRNPYDKSVYNVGYIGEGKYKAKDKNGNITIQYDYWRSMIRRCYDKKTLEKQPTYEDKYVCDEWHNFQNFAKWFDENYYECNDERMHLDKDIICKNNKIYSPYNCIFVPQRINSLFVRNFKSRGEFPIGVSLKKSLNKFASICAIYSKEYNKSKAKHLGYFNTPEEAFYKYKEFKESYIKEIAEEYKAIIPVELYNAMINYVVKITD